MKRTIITLTAFASIFLQTAWSSVLFANSALFNFQASGPVSLMTWLFQADNGSLLAVRQETRQPGGSACANFARTPQPDTGTERQVQSGNVVGLVVPGGRLSTLGAIVQDRPGGGIAAFLYVPLKDFQENDRGDN